MGGPCNGPERRSPPVRNADGPGTLQQPGGRAFRRGAGLGADPVQAGPGRLSVRGRGAYRGPRHGQSALALQQQADNRCAEKPAGERQLRRGSQRDFLQRRQAGEYHGNGPRPQRLQAGA